MLKKEHVRQILDNMTKLTCKSAWTINGALTDATLPVVMRTTCVNPGSLSELASKNDAVIVDVRK